MINLYEVFAKNFDITFNCKKNYFVENLAKNLLAVSMCT